MASSELPSPLLMAREPGNWVTKSLEFHNAGRILLEDYNRVNNELRLYEGKQIGPEYLSLHKRRYVTTPIIFCLSFSLELLVKGALIKQNPEKWIPNKGKSLLSHNVYNNIVEDLGIKLTDLEDRVAKRISDHVVWGKYPEKLRPSMKPEEMEELFLYHLKVVFSVNEYFQIINSIRDKIYDTHMKDYR